MRSISPERVQSVRQAVLETIVSPELTHEQKVSALAAQADSLLDVLDVPEGLSELLEQPIEKQCICDLNEGHAPLRPRYIAPDYAKFFRQGSEFLRLTPPQNLLEALDALLIIYKHVPSVTNYPVYLGQLDELLEPFVRAADESEAYELIKMFLRHVDRTVLDSFAHADIGPRPSKAGSLIMRAESELQDAVPNLTLKYDPGLTEDEFAREAVLCALSCAKPSFANHRLFQSELGEDYVIASCYNGLPLGGGSYTLCRLVLGNIAKRASSAEDFLERQLPYAAGIMLRYMDERIRFEAEESGFFANSFLIREGLIYRERFTAMFGLVGLADAVNILLEKEGRKGRFGRDAEAEALGVTIMEKIRSLNEAHVNPYCEVSAGHFLLHAQVGLASDVGVTPGTRVPIGEEPKELRDHLLLLSKFHKYFPSGTGDIFPLDVAVRRNPQYVLDIVKGAFSLDLRYLSFYASDSEVVRITGYLAKRSDMRKLDEGRAVLHDTTALGLGAAKNGRALQRRVIG